MPRYLLVMEQKGTGCDYTIGCGVETFTFGAEDDEEAKEQALFFFCGDSPIESCEEPRYWGDTELERMYLCRIVEHCPIDSWTDSIRAGKDEEAQLEVEKKERAELHRLQKKYGGEFFGG